MTTWVATGLLVVMTTIAGVFELTSIPFVRQPFASLTVGVAFLATAVWLKRSHGITAPALLGALFLLELSGEPFYQRHNLADWIIQSSLGLLALTGLTASSVLVRARVHRRRHTPSGPQQQGEVVAASMRSSS